MPQYSDRVLQLQFAINVVQYLQFELLHADLCIWKAAICWGCGKLASGWNYT